MEQYDKDAIILLLEEIQTNSVHVMTCATHAQFAYDMASSSKDNAQRAINRINNIPTTK